MLLGTDPPRLPVQVLVRTTELFGIAEGTTRTALSRMAAAGELVAGEGAYELAPGRLVERQVRQSASRAAHTRPWRAGRWTLAVVGARGPRHRADRAGTRDALVSARFAELREGVWLRPDNLDRPILGGVHVFTAVPDGDPVALAAELWDLGGWASTARELQQRVTTLLTPLEAGDSAALRDGFVLSAAVLRHFQHDPLLPAELAPEAWPGAALRADYDRYDQAYRRVLRTWFSRNRR